MKSFVHLIELSEEWLMERILNYAEKTGYTAYTSTLKEAWRLSISGLSKSIISATKEFNVVPELSPEFDFVSSSVAHFGTVEAQRHRARGISLAMFLGLFKYYRQSYLDLIEEVEDISIDRKYCSRFIERVFNIIEISFCMEWAGGKDDYNILNMQKSNREMTNEKNKYLTIFESFPSPVFLISLDGTIDNMNMTAAHYFNTEAVSGSHYYKTTFDNQKNSEKESPTTITESNLIASKLLPWLAQELQEYKEGKLGQNPFIKETTLNYKEYKFNVRISPMLDFSHKFDGIILILEDISKLAATEYEVQQLKGIIPICMHCKEIRDDKGYWNQLEKYISEHSEAQFSHSICDECLEKYYPEATE
jgi:hypothetical protein